MDTRAQHQDSGSPLIGGNSGNSAQSGGVPGTAASTVHDVLEKAETAGDHGEQKVQPVVSRVPQSAQAPLYEAVHAAADAAASPGGHADDLIERQEAMLHSATRYVREYPFQSVGIAVALGWLLGRITR